ncbi:MAG: spore coat associated protein CotJA [Lachnospiraceae bacterium]
MKDYRFLENSKVFPLAMAYVPWQHMENVYENLEEAFMIGTIFPELNKPFTGRRSDS